MGDFLEQISGPKVDLENKVTGSIFVCSYKLCEEIFSGRIFSIKILHLSLKTLFA